MSEKTTTLEILKSMVSTAKKGGHPLTEDQQILIAGSLASWIARVRAEEGHAAARAAVRNQRRAGQLKKENP